LEELERCVNELGFVGLNLNPDPSGGMWTGPPLTDQYWYPMYEKMVELDVPAMIHVSGSCNVNFHATGAYYINADTTAFMQLIQGDLFSDFPELRLIIPHGGGAVPYHWGRYRGLADMLEKPPLSRHVMQNVYFDTCVYHQPGIDLLFDVIDLDNILFGSEMIGAVRGVDSETGNYFDDTRRYVDAAALTPSDREQGACTRVSTPRSPRRAGDVGHLHHGRRLARLRSRSHEAHVRLAERGGRRTLSRLWAGLSLSVCPREKIHAV
jgi:4-oxalmesaconate hydratase